MQTICNRPMSKFDPVILWKPSIPSEKPFGKFSSSEKQPNRLFFFFIPFNHFVYHQNKYYADAELHLNYQLNTLLLNFI